MRQGLVLWKHPLQAGVTVLQVLANSSVRDVHQRKGSSECLLKAVDVNVKVRKALDRWRHLYVTLC